jgi:gamma-glutamyltranspeptidase/glutathione hydrolase
MAEPPLGELGGVAGSRESRYALRPLRRLAQRQVLARNDIAVTSQPLATSTAEQILMDGGNAIDAAVGAAATLGVVEPMSTGIGGDLFAIVWSARDQKLYGLSASGWAPKAWTPEYFASRGLDEVPSRGINSAVIPGTVSGWDALLKRFGSMGFEEVLEPARVLAQEGFPVHERVANDWAGSARTLREDRDSIRTWLPNGNAPAMYSIFRNPEMARALRTIQRAVATRSTRDRSPGRSCASPARSAAPSGSTTWPSIPRRNGPRRSRPTTTAMTSTSCRRPVRGSRRSRCSTSSRSAPPG